MVFCSRSLDISQAERIHLSNLALLAYCQQTLTKPALSRWFCSFKINHFAYLCVPGTTLMPAFCHSSLKMFGELFTLVDVLNLGWDCWKTSHLLSSHLLYPFLHKFQWTCRDILKHRVLNFELHTCCSKQRKKIGKTEMISHDHQVRPQFGSSAAFRNWTVQSAC